MSNKFSRIAKKSLTLLPGKNRCFHIPCCVHRGSNKFSQHSQQQKIYFTNCNKYPRKKSQSNNFQFPFWNRKKSSPPPPPKENPELRREIFPAISGKSIKVGRVSRWSRGQSTLRTDYKILPHWNTDLLGACHSWQPLRILSLSNRCTCDTMEISSFVFLTKFLLNCKERKKVFLGRLP